MNQLEAALSLTETPAEFFAHSQTNMFSMDRATLESLQLTALQHRFETLRTRIPMLQKMVESAGITKIERLEDIAPLLFKHTIYKSYPASLLSNNRFEAITKWLGKLTTHDLSGIDVSSCDGIDSWLSVMDEKSPLRVCHSSGTSGTVSFLPTEKDDFRRMASYWPMSFYQRFGEKTDYDGSPLNLEVVKFDYRTSYRSGGRLTDAIRDVVSGSEERFHALYPGRMSADLMYLAGKIRAAQAAGSLDTLEVAPALLARKGEFAEVQKRETDARNEFFTGLAQKLKGKEVVLYGYAGTVYQMMKDCQATGQQMDHLFAPGSLMVSGGGGKGVVLPPDWREQLQAFTGIDKFRNAYAMSEVMGMHPQCEHDNYHILPGILLLVLDPDSGEVLPRKGRVTGRAAFFDLGAKTRWGGFISGDEITVDWDAPCACGRHGPYVTGTIERYSAKQGGDDKINCAGTPQAQEDALSFLLDA